MSTLTTGQRLKLARTEAGLSQPELATLTGIDQGNISRYENGRLNPNAKSVDTIIAACVKHMQEQGKELSVLDAIDNRHLGIKGRTAGKLVRVNTMGTPKPVEWIVGGFAARRYVTMIAGQAGAGKSSVTQTLAVALARGDDEAMGLTLPGTPHRVMIVDAENVMVSDPDEEPEASLMQSRLQDYGLTEKHADNIVASGAAGFDLDKDRDGLDAFLSDCAAEGAPVDVLVLDSFTSLWFGNENVIDQVRGVLNFLNRMAVKHNLAVVLIHHADKAGETYRGSTAIAATIAAVFTFARAVDEDGEETSGTLRVLACVKMRMAAEPHPHYVHTSSHGILTEPCHCEACVIE